MSEQHAYLLTGNNTALDEFIIPIIEFKKISTGCAADFGKGDKRLSRV
jgi:hypothetical protein